MPHSRPTDAQMRTVIRKARRLLKQEGPDDISAGYRRGIVAALTWALGNNDVFDRLLRKRKETP